MKIMTNRWRIVFDDYVAAAPREVEILAPTAMDALLLLDINYPICHEASEFPYRPRRSKPVKMIWMGTTESGLPT